MTSNKVSSPLLEDEPHFLVYFSHAVPPLKIYIYIYIKNWVCITVLFFFLNYLAYVRVCVCTCVHVCVLKWVLPWCAVTLFSYNVSSRGQTQVLGLLVLSAITCVTISPVLAMPVLMACLAGTSVPVPLLVVHSFVLSNHLWNSLSKDRWGDKVLSTK